MRPSSGRSKPAISRSVVVFPEPDGPSSVKNSPASTSRSTWSTATTSPYVLRRPERRTSNAAEIVPVAGGRSGSVCVANRLLQQVESALEQRVVDRERHEDADDVAVHPAREQHEAALAGSRGHARGALGCPLGKLDGEHRAEASNLARVQGLEASA